MEGRDGRNWNPLPHSTCPHTNIKKPGTLWIVDEHVKTILFIFR